MRSYAIWAIAAAPLLLSSCLSTGGAPPGSAEIRISTGGDRQGGPGEIRLSPEARAAFEAYKAKTRDATEVGYFAVSRDGLTYAEGYCRDALSCRGISPARVVQACEQNSRGVPCGIYARGAQVVWTEASPPSQPSPMAFPAVAAGGSPPFQPSPAASPPLGADGSPPSPPQPSPMASPPSAAAGSPSPPPSSPTASPPSGAVVASLPRPSPAASPPVGAMGAPPPQPSPAALPPPPGDMAEAVRQAELLSKAGRYAEAEARLRRAIAIQERALGPDHPDLAVGLSELAEVYRTTGRHAEADSTMRRVTAISEAADPGGRAITEVKLQVDKDEAGGAVATAAVRLYDDVVIEVGRGTVPGSGSARVGMEVVPAVTVEAAAQEDGTLGFGLKWGLDY